MLNYIGSNIHTNPVFRQFLELLLTLALGCYKFLRVAKLLPVPPNSALHASIK